MKKVILGLLIAFTFVTSSLFAADGDLIVNGNVGVGTTTPAMKLDVNGGIRVGTSSATCNAAIAGSIRYNTTSKIIEFCNDTDWVAFGSNQQPADTYTKLLIHADGINSSFIDSSPGNKTITVNGNVTQSSTQFVFGGKSAYFDGTGGYLSLADSDDWNFGSGDFTIDGWINPASWHANSYQTIVSNYESSSNWWSLHAFYGQNRFRFVTTVNGTPKALTTDLHNLTDNTWHHIALVRSNGNFIWFIDGNILATVTNDIGTDNIANPSALLTIGNDLQSGGMYLTGYIDELRISKGIARWISNFTPPTAPY